MGCRNITTRNGTITTCDTIEEAKDHDPSKTFTDFTADVGLGVADAATSIVLFPIDALKYVTGADQYLGQRNSFSEIGTYLNLSWDGNPIIKTVDVVNTVFYGTVDLVLGHIPNYVVNEQLGLGFKHFTSAPQTVREWASTLTMGAALFVPMARKAAKQEVTAVPKVTPEIAYQKIFKQMVKPEEAGIPKFVPAPTVMGLFQYIPSIERFIQRIQAKWNALNLFSPNLTSILEKAKDRNSKAGITLYDLSTRRPAIFNANHIPALIEVAKVNSDAAWALSNLAKSRPDLASPCILALIEVAKVNSDAAWPLYDLATRRHELFNEGHISALTEAAKVNSDAASALYDLAKSRHELFKADHIPALTEAAKVNSELLSVLNTLKNQQNSPTE